MLAGAIGVGGVVAAAPASAGTCSSQTGGSSDTLIWTGSTYACGYVAASGNKSIGMGNTQTWTSSTAKGYVKRYTCKGQTGGVTVTYVYSDSGGTGFGSSITYTAFNGSSGSRHWNAAVLWNTSSAASNQYLASCSTNYSIGANLVRITKINMTGPSSVIGGQQAAFTTTVTAPDGGGTPTGTVVLYRQANNDVRSPVTKDCAGNQTGGSDVAIGSATLINGVATLYTPPTLPLGTSKIYASYTGTPVTSTGMPSYCLTPPQSGLSPARQDTSLTLKVTTAGAQVLADARPHSSDTSEQGLDPRGDIRPKPRPNPQLAVVNVQGLAPQQVAARCPVGTVALQSSVSSPTQVINDTALHTYQGAQTTIRTAGLPAGTRVDLQVVCRPIAAPRMIIGGAAYGSFGADAMSTTVANSVLFGGFGPDTLRVHHAGTLAVAGPGVDRIFLFASYTAGAGGPGNDVLRSFAPGSSLLNGGLGNDVLVGGPGPTLINAVDGSGGDRVICTGDQNRVMVDPGDKLFGRCTLV